MILEIIGKFKNKQTNPYYNLKGGANNLFYNPQPILIECKNKIDLNIPATSYKLSKFLDMLGIIPICIVGDDLSPFFDALFISLVHFKTGTNDVFIGAFDPFNSTDYEVIHLRVQKNKSYNDKTLHKQSNIFIPDSCDYDNHYNDYIINLDNKELNQDSLNKILSNQCQGFNSVYSLLKYMNNYHLLKNNINDKDKSND